MIFYRLFWLAVGCPFPQGSVLANIWLTYRPLITLSASAGVFAGTITIALS